ncbi:TetR/AcrR family transcriptional regulator [Nocardiopsis sp. MG754419]|uniref:TetR/AcrR family transcriptional regulator n=1 Tax=Nocardiopsis sp. MG754419 TaxID=2259865 RepID=UPI0020125011|nr:TetR/AcrR family transcriptional regulator [Nocardiopsis sp. MG754419]MBR8740165.1 TetR/AcrR family transcriptional regulator [Nocardiopsis sp. MG754419]
MGVAIDTPRKTPRQQRSRHTVEVLLEAAAQVFEREGYDATTNRIAERAGYSIGTLYQYFPNKRALLYALAERHVRATGARFGELFVRLRAEPPTWEDTLASLCEVLVAEHRDRPRLHVLMHRYAPRAPEAVAVLDAVRAEVVDELTWHLRRCGRGGSDPARTAALLVHTADAQLHGVLLDQEDAARTLAGSLAALTR